MKFRDLPSAKLGRIGEQMVDRLLRAAGAGVIASFKFSGENDNEAPAIEFQDERITLPDFDVFMAGKHTRIELKTYKEPQWNRAHRCLVHGIPTRLYEQYVEGERRTGVPAHLGILEVSSGSLLVSDEPISKIEPKYTCLCGCESVTEECDYRKKWGTGYPQWYFRRDRFTEWARLTGDDLARLQREHERVSHALRRHGDKRESAPRGALMQKPAWTWACLLCNVTGFGDASTHRCGEQPSYRRDYWMRRITSALKSHDATEAGAILSAPTPRALLESLLGPTWKPEADVR